MLPSIRVWYEADGDYSFLEVAEEDESNRIGDVTVDPDIEPEVISFDWDAFDFWLIMKSLSTLKPFRDLEKVV